MEWEVELIEWMQSHMGTVSIALGKALAFVGGEKGLLFVLLLVVFCWKKEVGLKLMLLVAAVNAWLPMIKNVVMRPRPYTAYPDRVEAYAPLHSGASLTDARAQGYSFPSIHSASVVALYFPLAQAAKKRWLWILAVIVTILVGVSRVAVGAHYPTDVLAGWALGFVAIGIFWLLEKYVQREWVRHLILLATVLPGLFFVRTADYYTSLGMLIGLIAAIPFERKYIQFQDTRNIWAMILRTVIAFAIYLVLNTLLKMPFSGAFLSSGTLAAFLVRTARYAVIIFLIMGVYPKVFPLFEKIGGKK